MEGISGVVFFAAFVFLGLSLFILLLIILINRRNLDYQKELHAVQQQKQRAMLQAAFEAQERERDRMGRDVHDDVGPMLSTLKFSVAKIKRLKDPEAINSNIKKINKEIDAVVQRVRAVSRDLSPVILTDFGIEAALEDLCERINISNTIAVQFNATINKDVLTKQEALAIYRIIQELCNNALKHAEATELIIRLDQTENKITASVADNGKGMPSDLIKDGKPLSKGIGLRNIEARASMINAEIQMESSAEKGTKIMLEFMKSEFSSEI